MYSLTSVRFALTALLTLLYLTPVLSAPSGVCGIGLYKALLVLSAYPPAESYCSQHYPLAPSTSTITGATSSFTVTATATAISDVQATSTAPDVTATAMTSTTTYTTATAPAVTSTLPLVTVTAATVSTTSTVATVTVTSTGAMKIRRTISPREPATGVAAIWSSIESEAASFVKTLCSCIETTPTVKVTIFPSVTQTLTGTVTTTYTSTSVVTPTTTVTSTISITSDMTVTPTVTSAPSTTFTPTTTISVTATVTTTVRPAATYHLDFSGSCCYNHYDTFPDLPGNPNEATGITECQALCDQDSSCNVVALVNYKTFSACAIDSAPYDSSYVESPCYGYCDVYTRVPLG